MNNQPVIKNLIDIAHQTNSYILPNNSLFSLDTMKTLLNNNVAIIGTSGSNKTRSTIIPNILSAVGSYIVSDPKGTLYKRYSKHMRNMGYRIVHLDFIHPLKSDHYNPLRYVHTSDDILRLSHQIIYTKSDRVGGSYDPFWDKSAEILLTALIGYITENGEECENNLSYILRMLEKMNVDQIERGIECELDKMFRRHSKKNGLLNIIEPSWAYQQYIKFRQVPQKTLACIIATVQAAFATIDTKEIREMISFDETAIRSIGKEPSIVFVEISDTDRSKDFLANIFYSQAMNELCSYADDECKNNQLDIPVRFILDDFGTNCRIAGFENMISNIRSRGISATIVLQSESQLEDGYGSGAHTILDNCDTMLYMGGNDIITAELIAKRANRPLQEILTMPVKTNWLFRRGEKPKFSKTVDLSEYDFKLQTVEIWNQNAFNNI